MQKRWIVVIGAMLVGAGAVFGALAQRGREETKPLPPGHPPTGGQQSRPFFAPPSPESGTGATGLRWTVPSGWTKETPSSSMRRAQYRLPGPAGAGVCVVFYFGPGQGGDAKANVARWVGQFRRPDGKPVAPPKTREFEVGGAPAVLVEVSGTYVGGMGGGPAGPERPNYMLLGAVVKGPDANWFFRALGPRATMQAHRAAFERMVRSIKGGQGT